LRGFLRGLCGYFSLCYVPFANCPQIWKQIDIESILIRKVQRKKSMKGLNNGEHYGKSKRVLHINGLTVMGSTYHNQTSCPWHYHQNAHFAFTTKGNLIETHKKHKINLSPGCLMYNHSQEAHYNSDYSELVSALHVDIEANWFNKYGFKIGAIEGVHVLQNPILKNLFINLYKEVNFYNNLSALTIESLIIQAMNELIQEYKVNTTSKPAWTNQVKDLLYSYMDIPLTLEKIAREINIHPVYLCQQFPVYFHCTFGDYIRKIKIEKAVEFMISNPRLSLTKITYACGFCDQSHFIRLFKKNIGVTPLAFRRMIGSS
jgi:YesN/AraC family two-component response regulator